MPKIAYTDTKFRGDALAMIDQANAIIAEYLAAGFRLTLRQLYYQFVSRDLIPNQQKEYKRLGSIVNDARLAGLIDWSAIEDRGGNLISIPSWRSPSDLIEACADQFRLDPWANQDDYVEVWIEKEALIGVVAVPCEKLRLPHFACKGYTSQSEMWNAGHGRLRLKARQGKGLTIIHLGDHDPSGIDMTRDIEERLGVFAMGRVEVIRIALNMDQVEEFNPPPNPAKLTDSRFEGYAAKFGGESWELDALNPDTIAGLIEAEAEKRIYRIERLATGPDGKRANWTIVRREPVVRIRFDTSKATASLRKVSRALSLLGGAAAYAGAAFDDFGRAYRSPEVAR